MTVNLVTKKGSQPGSMTAYLYGLKSGIENHNINHNIIFAPHFKKGIPVVKRILEYLYAPIYLKNHLKNGLVHFLTPDLGYMLHFIRPKKTIITVHDIYYTVFDLHKGLHKLNYDFETKGMLKADLIIADSENTKRDLINYLNYPQERIKVVLLGVDHNKFKKIEIKKDPSKKIILHIGADKYGGRKNIQGLLKAFAILHKKLPNIKLIQAGTDPKEFDTLIRNLGIENNVEFKGFVSEKEKIKLYNLADVFVFPSIYEGFGLPPLEAMACGCPVITSNAASLPEVVGDAGIMVDPQDNEGLAEAMHKVLTDKNLALDMSKKSLERANLFSWEKTAEKTLGVYKEL